MLDDQALDHLRRSATLAAVFPVSLHIHDADQLRIEVTRPPWTTSTAPTVMAPCNFRNAIARAWTGRQKGGRFGLCGFSTGERPDIRIVLPEGGWTDSVALHHVPLSADVVRCFPTSAPHRRCEAVATGLGLYTCHDPLLDVTLVHTTMPRPTQGPDLLADALAQLVADETEGTLNR